MLVFGILISYIKPPEKKFIDVSSCHYFTLVKTCQLFGIFFQPQEYQYCGVIIGVWTMVGVIILAGLCEDYR